jgi:putative transposase
VIQGCFLKQRMSMADRLVLSDGQWARIAPHVIGDHRSPGTSGRDNRLFVEAVLWIARTGAPWRDLPDSFGNANSIFRRFSRWSKKGVWQRLFAAVSDDPDFEYLILDSTIVGTVNPTGLRTKFGNFRLGSAPHGVPIVPISPGASKENYVRQDVRA